ncbi:hypothetical protein [Methanonatronarchaeum sp. AMET-Sl]|uniref:hypothetical protein n=1 Tax=Methanonatronarchaeum sp. AMET-Sl TaxID=3037654 RepID=UPI00244DA89C|nr:hypothetical protein [Methanonatronarchaeum sp. AMET-Sl]WGI17128.1 hypothetical protein QEN48_06405 [Methanonatronarchaeum sp. AMET-Sl]
MPAMCEIFADQPEWMMEEMRPCCKDLMQQQDIEMMEMMQMMGMDMSDMMRMMNDK